MKIIDYKIESANTAQELEKRVKNSIGQGWQPIGGLSVAIVPGASGAVAQAMVKYV